MPPIELAGCIALRATIAYVYLRAMYLNTRDAAARQWLVEHTAYMFPSSVGAASTTVKLAAAGGMFLMLAGGLSILLGIEGRVGAFGLLIFTAGGIYQHKRERDVALDVAAKLKPFVSHEGQPHLATLQWSALSGHVSSELKNWALCGACAAISAWGTGPWSLSDHVGRWLGL